MQQLNISKLFINTMRMQLVEVLKEKKASKDEVRFFLKEATDGDILSIGFTNKFIPKNNDHIDTAIACTQIIKEYIETNSMAFNNDQLVIDEFVESLSLIKGNVNSLMELNFSKEVGEYVDTVKDKVTPLVDKARDGGDTSSIQKLKDMIEEHGDDMSVALLVSIVGVLAILAYKRYKKNKKETSPQIEIEAIITQMDVLKKNRNICNKSKDSIKCKQRIDKSIKQLADRIKKKKKNLQK